MLRILLWMGHEEDDYDDPGMTAEEFWKETKPLISHGCDTEEVKSFIFRRLRGG